VYLEAAMGTHVRTVLRIAFSILIILHALAHAVLPLRGLVAYPPQQGWMSPLVSAQSLIVLVGFSLALVALFSGGLGILGSRVLGFEAVRLVELGLAASVVALIGAWSAASWWGLAVDAVIAGGIAAARNTELSPIFGESGQTAARWRLRRVAFESLAVALVGYMAVATALWPWHRQWGTTEAERFMALPGDAVIRDPANELMHAVTIDAPPEAVFPWLAQLGQDRAGFYSYDWLERLFLADVHNANEIRPEWQHRAAGEFVRSTQPTYMGGLLGPNVGWQITHFDPPRAMVLKSWGAFVLQSTPDGKTRLYIRTAMGGPDVPVWAAGLTFAAFELPHFIMQRKMMLGIKERAERFHRGLAGGGHAPALVLS
jgi:hypothetical protein